jgi:hypothetical protein
MLLNSYYLFFFFLVEPGFKHRTSCLQSRSSITWNTPPAYFALVILEMGVSQTICPDWPQTKILPILASQVAKVTGMNHQHPAITQFENWENPQQTLFNSVSKVLRTFSVLSWVNSEFSLLIVCLVHVYIYLYIMRTHTHTHTHKHRA